LFVHRFEDGLFARVGDRGVGHAENSVDRAVIELFRDRSSGGDVCRRSQKRKP
jgi:hypothetical protein